VEPCAVRGDGLACGSAPVSEAAVLCRYSVHYQQFLQKPLFACSVLQTEVHAEKWSKDAASTKGLVLAYDFSPGKLQGEPGSQVAASSWMD
jgi:hypothetical protein